jgi:hypothetical protein
LLPAYNVVPSGVTVAGISSGGFMAVQRCGGSGSLVSGSGVLTGDRRCKSVMSAFTVCDGKPTSVERLKLTHLRHCVSHSANCPWPLLQVAYSQQIFGAAIFAGGPYYCAQEVRGQSTSAPPPGGTTR